MDAYQNLISGDKSPLDGHNGCSQYFSSQVINAQHYGNVRKSNYIYPNARFYFVRREIFYAVILPQRTPRIR